MIHVIATIRAQDSKLEVLTSAFRAVLPQVRAKPGCIEYKLAINLRTGMPGQSTFSDDELVVIEKWTNLDALRVHLLDPIYRSWYTTVWHLVAEAAMQVFEDVD